MKSNNYENVIDWIYDEYSRCSSDTVQVPDAAKAAFTKANPNIAGLWENEKGGYEVNFKSGGKKMYYIIDIKGSILELKVK